MKGKYPISERDKQWLKRRVNGHIRRIIQIQKQNKRERERELQAKQGQNKPY